MRGDVRPACGPLPFVRLETQQRKASPLGGRWTAAGAWPAHQAALCVRLEQIPCLELPSVRWPGHSSPDLEVEWSIDVLVDQRRERLARLDKRQVRHSLDRPHHTRCTAVTVDAHHILDRVVRTGAGRCVGSDPPQRTATVTELNALCHRAGAANSTCVVMAKEDERPHLADASPPSQRNTTDCHAALLSTLRRSLQEHSGRANLAISRRPR